VNIVNIYENSSGFRFKPDIFHPDQNPGQNPDIRIKKKSGFIRIHPDETETDRSTNCEFYAENKIYVKN
jgi:hypothetical protein